MSCHPYPPPHVMVSPKALTPNLGKVGYPKCNVDVSIAPPPSPYLQDTLPQTSMETICQLGGQISTQIPENHIPKTPLYPYAKYQPVNLKPKIPENTFPHKSPLFLSPINPVKSKSQIPNMLNPKPKTQE